MAQFNGCDERFVGVFGDEEGCENLTTRMYPFVRSDKEVAELLLKTKAAHDNKSTMVIFTFADPELRARASRMCELSDLKYVDLLGNMFDVLSEFLQRKPLGAFSLEANSRKPKQRSLSDDYFRRIDAVGKFVPNDSKEMHAETDTAMRSTVLTTLLGVFILKTEFTLKCDDGCHPELMPEADVVLTGVSRT
jgi:regulator of PEP synthase PpsR (kinase-PPPase family)